MRISLQELTTHHPKLLLIRIDYHAFGALALQQAGHIPPRVANVLNQNLQSEVSVDWLDHDLEALTMTDQKFVTEYGAEAVALGYLHSSEGWVVKRRLQQGESADWLMTRERADLAIEVSGVAIGHDPARLGKKINQLSKCSLPVERLAVVIDFQFPSILVGRP